MVAEHGQGTARLDQLLDHGQHGRTVRSTVTKVPHKNQGAALWMDAFRVVTQVLQQGAKRVVFAVDVANNVQWARG